MQLSLFVSVWNNEEALNSALFSCMIIYSKYIEYKISQTLTYTLVSMSAFLPDVYTSGFLHFILCSVQIIIGLYYVLSQSVLVIECQAKKLSNLDYYVEFLIQIFLIHRLIIWNNTYLIDNRNQVIIIYSYVNCIDK